jgi:hypothetical protein
MNFSHGEYEYHQSVIDNTRKMVAGTCSPCRKQMHEHSLLLQRILPAARSLLLSTLCVLLCLHIIHILILISERPGDPDRLDARRPGRMHPIIFSL